MKIKPRLPKIRFPSLKPKREMSRDELLEYWLNSFVWSTVFVVVFSVSIFLIWWVFSRSHPKILTGVNYFRSPVTVKIEDSEYALEQFDTFEHVTETKGDVVIKVFDENGSEVQKVSHYLSNLAGVSIDFLAPTGGVDLCPVQVDVTELFYPRPEKLTQEAYMIRQLTSEPSRSFYYQYSVFAEFSNLLAFHNYDGLELPADIPPHQKIHGIFFMECNKLDDQKAVTIEARWWISYNPETQMQLYQEGVEEVERTPEYSL